jgi:hypothetical protein
MTASPSSASAAIRLERSATDAEPISRILPQTGIKPDGDLRRATSDAIESTSDLTAAARQAIATYLKLLPPAQ